MTHSFLRFGVGTTVAIALCLALPSWAQVVESGSSSAVSTPRAPDGHPDLSGMWNGAAAGINRTSEEGANLTSNVASRRCAPNQRGCGDQTTERCHSEKSR